ncbi:hypothetical protein OY671_012447, partial [Metschnikowia pulcherrima]
GPGVRRDDSRVARRAHHACSPGAVDRGAGRRSAAHRRLHPHAQQRQGGDAARPCRAQGRHSPASAGRRRPAAAVGRSAADRGLSAASPGRPQPNGPGHDPRRHGPGARGLRRRRPPRRPAPRPARPPPRPRRGPPPRGPDRPGRRPPPCR